MRSWNELSNLHKGEIVLVIGNGPSLNDVPLEFLNKYPSFGTNRIYLLDDFTPTYYVAVDPLAIKPSIDEIKQIDCLAKFISDPWHYRFDAYPLNSSVIPLFSREPDKWIYEGYTVTYVCLQIAFFMGFTTVLLVGVDHNYVEDGSNYFTPEYNNGSDEWGPTNLTQSGIAYKIAKTVFDDDGRRIVNLTPGSKLDVFERGEIAEW
jgi:hypothetical protein